jgi:6-phosphogluconolactonase
MRYLAIDYGGKRTGLALCDGAEMIASPVAVIENKAQVIPEILSIIARENVEAVVVGLPLNMDGSEGPAVKAVRGFAKELAGHVSIPIIFHDERLSSFEAEEKLAAADFTRKKKKKRVDAVAAATILQSFLDKKHEAGKFRANIAVARNYEELSRKALDLFVEAAKTTINGKDVFFAAISGGNTPKRFFELIGESPESRGLSWDKIHIFWVDERCVPPGSEQSNYKLAAEAFLSKVSIPPENVHRIMGEAHDLEFAANAYENAIRKVFNIGTGDIPVFDLIILGIGADGHTASLFPNSKVISEARRLAAPVYPAGGNLNRITLTVPVLLGASRLIVMAAGQDKAETLHDVLSSEPDKTRYPIQALWPVLDKITWLLDATAASLLKADYP